MGSSCWIMTVTKKAIQNTRTSIYLFQTTLSVSMERTNSNSMRINFIQSSRGNPKWLEQRSFLFYSRLRKDDQQFLKHPKHSKMNSGSCIANFSRTMRKSSNFSRSKKRQHKPAATISLNFRNSSSSWCAMSLDVGRQCSVPYFLHQFGS